VLFLADSDQEIVWLNVSVKEMTGVYELDSLKHLIGQHEDGLKGKLAFAVVE